MTTCNVLAKNVLLIRIYMKKCLEEAGLFVRDCSSNG